MKLHANASPTGARSRAAADLQDRLCRALLDGFQPTLRGLDAPSCLALLSSCVAARMLWGGLAEQLLEQLSAECEPGWGGEAALGACPPQALAAVLVACATLGQRKPPLPGLAAEECVRRQFAGFDAVALSDAAWSMAKLQQVGPSWFEAVDVCQAPEALAWIGQGTLARHGGLVAGLLREAERRDDPGAAQDLQQLNMLVEAYLERWRAEGNTARLQEAARRAVVLKPRVRRHPSPGEETAQRHRILKLLATGFKPRLPTLDPAACIALLQSCVAADYFERFLARALLARLGSEEGLAALQGEGGLRARSGRARADLLLACTRSPVDQGALVRLVAEECARLQFRDMDAKALADAAWSVAKLTHVDPTWFDALVETLERPGGPLGGATLPDLSRLWEGLAEAKHVPASRTLQERATSMVLAQGPEASIDDCASLLRSMARVGLADERLADALAARLGGVKLRSPKEVSKMAILDSIWGLVSNGPEAVSRHGALIEALMLEADRRWNAGEPPKTRPRRLYKEPELAVFFEAIAALQRLRSPLKDVLRPGKGDSGCLVLAARNAHYWRGRRRPRGSG